MTTDYEHDPFARAPSAGKKSHPSALWWELLALVFLIGLGVRLYDLQDPPLDFHPTRQLHSALIARGMYYQQRSDLPDWQREMAVSQWQQEGEIEPQLFERLVAWLYRQVGETDLRIPRLISIATWMVGAAFVIWLTADLAGWGGALTAAWFFLLWPYGVTASRSFQPEPALVSLMAATLWAAWRWKQWGGWKWALVTGLLAGGAIYLKVVAAFFLGPALLVLVVARGGSRWYRSPQVWVIAALALVPYAAYHIDGVYIRGTLASQFSLRFFPEMWVDPAFYLRWIGNLGRVLPFEMVVAALLGSFLLREPADRALLVALWAGYFVYGMALPHHISTHDYYHLLLFPALALGIAGLSGVVFRGIRGPGWLAQSVTAGALVVVMIMSGYTARTTLKRFDAAGQTAVWIEIGDYLGQGAPVAALVPDYGVGLKYWGWINPSVWLTGDEITWRQSIGQEIDFAAWFEEQAAGKGFFVVTLFDELDRQPLLKSLLYERYPVLKETPEYLIFDLRNKTR